MHHLYVCDFVNAINYIYIFNKKDYLMHIGATQVHQIQKEE